MTTATPRLHYTFAEYLRHEAESGDKHEYVAGLILAMAGGTLEHGALASAVIIALGTQVRGRRCRVFDSDARVRVRESGNAYYPDASVVRGALEVDDDDPESMVNPVVLVEVLSPSTADYDSSDKLFDYQRIPSLCHIVHVAYDEHCIDVWTRSGETWTKTAYGEGSTAALSAIDCALDVTELYRDPLSAS